MRLRPYRWLWRAGRQKGRTPGSDLWDNRRRLIRELVPGKSFIDVGGMFGIHGAVAFLAEEANATSVTLYDAMDPTEEFQRVHRERGSGVRYVQGDLHDRESIASLGSFDIVWCGGVIYHSPNPFQLIEHLRTLTDEHLLPGTHLIPEIPGFEQTCVWYPGLSDEMRAALAWAHGRECHQLIGLGTPFDPSPMMGYRNVWWGISRSALSSMLEVARYEVIEEFSPHPLFIDVHARPADAESTVPPPDFSRRRGEQRRASSHGEVPTWA